MEEIKEIKSAYRFIPVEKDEEYFSPEWRNQVSMDIPFKDNVSGEIDYTLKANTALFIKGADGDFCNVNGEYFIPGTSIKGCIRSVLEILSFGHLNESRVQDNAGFPFRDISDQDGYMKKMNKVYCGWLDDKGEIHNWGIPKHIKYDELRPKDKQGSNNTKDIKDMDVIEKYQSFKNLTDTFTPGSRLPYSHPSDEREFCEKKENGLAGTIIFSGYIITKKSDFVLLDKDCNDNSLTVSDSTLKDFHSLYKEFEKIPINTNKGGRPIFFTKVGNSVKTIGLSYLHKYYAESTIREAIPDKMKGGDLDLADVMFGSAKYNLRGRIQFGRARMIEGKKLYDDDTSILAVLGSPHASYYPTYLQNGTWDSSNCIISGIKRYPIKPVYDVGPFILTPKDKEEYKKKFGPLPSGDSKILSYQHMGESMIPYNEKSDHNFDTISRFKPLQEKSTFEGTIRFFNLKQEEFGALLSALTFHGHSECKHSLGQAKALGYGSVSLSINKIIFNDEEKADISSTQKRFLQLFANMMNKQYPNWEKSLRIKELFAMAKGFTQKNLVDVFTPMILSEFGKVKGKYMSGKYEFPSYIAVLTKKGIDPSPSIVVEKIEVEKAQAEIVVFNQYAKQAILLAGKDKNPKELINNNKDKLKVGDTIEVEIKRDKGGNIKKLIYKRKI